MPAYLGGPPTGFGARGPAIMIGSPAGEIPVLEGAEGSSICSQQRPGLLIFLCMLIKTVVAYCNKQKRAYLFQVDQRSSAHHPDLPPSFLTD